jgi:hypothetical protein
LPPKRPAIFCRKIPIPQRYTTASEVTPALW